MKKNLILEIAASIERTWLRLKNSEDKFLSKEAERAIKKIKKSKSLIQAKNFEKEFNQKIKEKYITQLNYDSLYKSAKGKVARSLFIQASLVALIVQQHSSIEQASKTSFVTSLHTTLIAESNFLPAESA